MATDGTGAAPTSSAPPSLLTQAARTAAEADGLAPPKADESQAAAAMLTSIGGVANEAKNDDSGLTALERARSAIAAAQATKKPETAGSAAHARQAGGPAVAAVASAPPPLPVRKAPAPAPASSAGSKKKGPPLRRGKWTPEEEAYANRLIQEFKAGLLPLTDGTTLRTFLSKLLNCDPMRISKKFVGSNCIGKQVFRRRTADINRLTPEQIQQSRAELSELERRFLERVAQTNRVKSSGVTSGAGTAAAAAASVGASLGVGPKLENGGDNAPPSPPWLQPPLGYKHGTGAAMAAAANSRAAAAGRALLQGMGAGSSSNKQSNSNLRSHGSAGLLAMAELHRRTSTQNLLQSALGNQSSANNLLAAAAAAANAGGSGLSGSAMAQIARNASAARLAGLTAAGSSMNNLLLKAGLSRDQLSQLARDGGVPSSTSLSNMMERQSSFDALMSLDFQSLQSIDNLANLIQTGAQANQANTSQSDMKNWSADLAAAAASGSSSNNTTNGSNSNLSSLANARRLASAGHMESLLRSLSSGNVNKATADSSNNGGSNANFSNVLQSMQSNLGSLGNAGNSANSLFGSGNTASALSLASMLRADSSTGLSQLRVQDGLTQRNTSVDDFLSLVASGDIPHQDPTLLNVPLMHQQQGSKNKGGQSAASVLAQQQLLAQAANSGNSALANAIRTGSLGNLQQQKDSSANSSGAGNSGNSSATALAQQQQQARAAQLGLTQAKENNDSTASLKRKLMDLEGTTESQGEAKRS